MSTTKVKNTFYDVLDVTLDDLNIARDFYDRLQQDGVQFQSGHHAIWHICETDVFFVRQELVKARSKERLLDYIECQLNGGLATLASEINKLQKPLTIFSSGKCGYDSINGRVEWEDCLIKALRPNSLQPSVAILNLGVAYMSGSR